MSITSAWINLFQPNPEATLRLFCFPYAGGASHIYRDWAPYLFREVEVCPIELPGRGSRIRETPFSQLEPLLESLTNALLPWLNKPFVFFGHSLGGLIAFELATKTSEEYGLEPLHLFVSGRHAPRVPELTPATYNLPRDEFVEELRRLKGTPPQVLDHPELLDLILPTLRADFEICQSYEYAPKPALNCSITAFGGVDDTDVPREQIEPWREHTNSSFSLRMLPGDHFFLHSSKLMLQQMLSLELQKILARKPGPIRQQTAQKPAESIGQNCPTQSAC